MPTKKETKEKKPKTLMDRLLDFQKKVGVIAKDKKNPFFKSNYVDINGLISDVKPILNECGLLITQPLTHIEELPALKTIISAGKEMIQDTVILPQDPNPQKMGAIITYYRRYALQSLLFLQAEDDDAESAQDRGKTPKTPKTPYKAPQKAYTPKEGDDSRQASEKQRKWVADIWSMPMTSDVIQNLTFKQASQAIEQSLKNSKDDSLTKEQQVDSDEYEKELDVKEIPF